jgi:malate dehydrogenase (oxaloacetate-decarboxylating)
VTAVGGNRVVVAVRATRRAHLSGAVIDTVARVGAEVTRTEVTDRSDGALLLRLHCRLGMEGTPEQLVGALGSLDGCAVDAVEDSVFLVHGGGKVSVDLRYPIAISEDLSQVYTPGVARVCSAIADDPSRVRDLTIKGNTVAVVTDGSAVLGLGNIGPEASMPVMEGKAALFKRFAGIDAWPIALDTQDVDDIVRTVAAIAPGFGGINLEDISAPRCFEIERRLRDLLRIPVFHDDQHGTAVVVLAALQNAARVVGKDLTGLRVVMTGAGAAGAAVAHLLLAAGVSDIVLFDSKGALYTGRDNLDPDRTILAERTNPRRHVGDLTEALLGADVFIGLSRPGMLTELDVAGMADGAIVFALANPDPEIDPRIAARHAAVVATGRSDYPNQINNVLAFPGIFRGLLDANAHRITDDLLVAAANAIAASVTPDTLDAGHIVPSVFEPGLADRVATATRQAITNGVH